MTPSLPSFLWLFSLGIISGQETFFPQTFPYSWYPDPAPSTPQDMDRNSSSQDRDLNPICGWKPIRKIQSNLLGEVETACGGELWWFIILSPPDFRPLLGINCGLPSIATVFFSTPPSNYLTATGCPIIQLDSDTVYLESSSRSHRLRVPSFTTDLHFRHPSQVRVVPVLLTNWLYIEHSHEGRDIPLTCLINLPEQLSKLKKPVYLLDCQFITKGNKG